MDADTAYAVKCGAFEGPLELLLHLIKKNEMNIYDIPIAEITAQYLKTLDLMRALNLSVAGEFLVMAATLIHIKSKMLLPEPDDDEADAEDPRGDLVQRLLAYQQFKAAAGALEERESLWREIFRRDAAAGMDLAPEETPISDLNLYDLISALNDLLADRKTPLVMEMIADPLTVREKVAYILEHIGAAESLLFTDLFSGDVTRHAVIVTFLALLEVIRLGLVRVTQGSLCGPLRLMKTENLGRS